MESLHVFLDAYGDHEPSQTKNPKGIPSQSPGLRLVAPKSDEGGGTLAAPKLAKAGSYPGFEASSSRYPDERVAPVINGPRPMEGLNIFLTRIGTMNLKCAGAFSLSSSLARRSVAKAAGGEGWGEEAFRGRARPMGRGNGTSN